MSIPRVLALLAMLLFWTPARGAEVPVAIIYSLTGDASIAAPATARRPLRLFDRLPAGTTLKVGPESRLALAFMNGRRYELGESSRVTLGPQDLASRNGLVRPLRPVPPLPLILPIAAEDNPGGLRIRTETIRGLYPDRGAVTLAEATVLRFESVGNTAKYRVEVQDAQGKVAFTTDTTITSILLPEEALQPGMRYVWTVRTLEREGPVAQGKADFVTLSAQAAEAREALRKAVEAEEDNDSLALLAEIDQSLGLLEEARDGLQAALRASPGETGLTETLAELERRLPYRQSP